MTVSINLRKVLLAILACLLLMATVARADDGSAPSAPDAAATAADYDWTQLDEDEQELQVSDPLEPVNRGIFWFNDKLYFYLFKPVARGYRVVPEPVRESVGNAFDNIGAPVRFLNSLLQGKVRGACYELATFMINSTWGLGGLFDLTPEETERPDAEDFGQTLGRYGSPPGFYLVMPFLGPSNARDFVGRFADSFVHPVSSPEYLIMKPLEVAGLQTYDRINALSLDKDTYEAIKRDALDPYLFVRNAYLQMRAARVAE
ncbi:MAG: VacJ family lipoprotein [Desulfuromonadales bacterium]